MQYAVHMGRSLVAEHPSVEPSPNELPQRARLLVAMVQAVAEHGYEGASVADAVRLAHVSRSTFYELFASKEECLLAAYTTGYGVLDRRIDEAVRSAGDWREMLRLGFRAYLEALASDPLFARVYLIEGRVVGDERDRVLRRFADRYARTFALSPLPVPPHEVLILLAAGVHELACARVRSGGDVRDLEDILMGCAVRLVGEREGSWT
jgi:AcrR family transcriptional regulator